MKTNNSFGINLKAKREEQGIGLREMARRLNISHVYLSDIEKGSEFSPKNEVLAKIIKILNYSEADQALLYELAAKARPYPTIPEDISEYIAGDSNLHLRNALRIAKKLNVTDKEWGEFIDKIIKNRIENKNITGQKLKR
jgi:DNA-binding XRE family transcriptional regulator